MLNVSENNKIQFNKKSLNLNIMYYLIFYDYKDDVKKISLARLLKKERSLSLSESKNAVDKLIEGIPVFFGFTSKPQLQNLHREALLLGVKCKIKDARSMTVFVNRENILKPNGKTALQQKKIATTKKQSMEFSEVLMY